MNYKEIEDLAGHRPVSAWVVKLVGDAVAIEREACAKVCDRSANEALNLWPFSMGANHCAAAIRARGQNQPETVSPAELRWRANRPWDDKESY